jgi:hypothetical protein
MNSNHNDIDTEKLYEFNHYSKPGSTMGVRRLTAEEYQRIYRWQRQKPIFYMTMIHRFELPHSEPVGGRTMWRLPGGIWESLKFGFVLGAGIGLLSTQGSGMGAFMSGFSFAIIVTVGTVAAQLW